MMLPVGSAVRMEGAAANEYEHAVPPTTARRVSLTFRRRMDVEGEQEAIEAQTTLTERFRAIYRAKRRERAGEDASTSVSGKSKAASEEERRRARIVAERAVIKAAREERKRAKQLRKAGKQAEAEAAEARAREIRPNVGDVDEREKTTTTTTSDELVKKPPKRSCAVVPENLIDSTKTVTAMPDVEREHVQKVYDIVARQWHGTRYRAWTRVEAFVRKQPPGCLVADVGCGNGKNIPEVVAGGGIALEGRWARARRRLGRRHRRRRGREGPLGRCGIHGTADHSPGARARRCNVRTCPLHLFMCCVCVFQIWLITVHVFSQ